MPDKGKFDPYAAGSAADKPTKTIDPVQTGKMYFYFAARGLGVFLIVCALYLVLNVFGLVKTLIENPEVLMAHVNGWVEPMDLEAEAVPAEVTTLSDSDSEALATGENAVEVDGQQAGPSPFENARSKARHAGQRSASDDATVSGLLDRILDALESGNLARVFAVFTVFLFAWLLVKIPFLLLRAGIALATDSTQTEKKK